MKLSFIDFDCACGQFIAKNISNDGELTLYECKTTKPGFETLNVELGDKQVPVIKTWKILKKLFISDSYLEILLMYENFFRKFNMS